MHTKNKHLSYKHLNEPLDKGRFVFGFILAGNLQAFIMCRPQLFLVQDTLDCTLHLFGLTFSLEILFLVKRINCSFLVRCT